MTRSDPLFSVVIPAYNAPELVLEAIDSVFAQSVEDFEIVVIDDGSRDRTADRVEAHTADPRLRLVRQENQGVARAKNAGIEAARGAFIAFLDQDDLLMPDYLERFAAGMQTRPEAAFAFTDGWLLDRRTGRVSRRSMSPVPVPDEPPADPAGLAEELARANFIATAVTVRRAAVDDVGVYDSRANGADDYELWLRLLAHGWSGVRIPGRLVLKGYADDAQSRNDEMMVSATRTALELFSAQEAAPPTAVAIAQERIAALGTAADPPGFGDRAYRSLRRVGGRLLAPLRWHRRAPHEIAQAYPWLSRRGGGGRSGPASRPS